MIALLGGTFNPIHNGHLYIAEEALTAFSAEKVIFIPSREPPHRDEPVATPEQRADMVRLAIEGKEEFEFSDVELERPGPSYTIDTVKTIIKYYPDDELGLIVGSDAFNSFTTWLHWEEILEYCRLIVVNRDTGEPSKQSDENIKPEHILTLEVDPCPVSATQIRAFVAHGEPIDELVPEAVKQYIYDNKIYRS
jgi:nicotinate-nucleotide adenylyltransferase